MFTGIIQTVGEIRQAQRLSGDLRLHVAAPELKYEVIALGDSIAVNGVCLTVVAMSQSVYTFDVSLESLSRTLLGEWGVGTPVNLELAMLPTTRFGGHMVSGHVDGIGEVIKIQQDARSQRWFFKAPESIQKYIAEKGSITIDGISLTVNGEKDGVFHVNIVPHTQQVTTLGALRVGAKVHLEVDLIARYLERLLQRSDDGHGKIDRSFLAKNGFC